MSKKYKTAEKLLYTYPVNLMRHKEALLDYCRLKSQTDCHAQNYNSQPASVSQHSDPPADYVNRLMNLERLIHSYSAKTREINFLRYDLKHSTDEREQVMFQIMELYYFDQMDFKDLAAHLQINNRTLYRRREELVRLLMRRLDKPQEG